MSIWSKVVGIFSNDDIMNKKDGHLANVGAWVGNLKFTSEEMAEMDAKMAEGVRKFAVDTLSENTERSKARREIAKFIIKFYCILVFMSVMVYKIDVAWAKFIFDVYTATALGGAFIAVIVFFFGSHWHRTAKGSK